MIDVNSGTVVFDDNLRIDAHTPLEKIETMPNIRPAPSILGKTQLSVGMHTACGHHWGVGVVYVHSKLTQIGLQCQSVDGIESTTWNLENEKRRKLFHDAWVNKTCSSRNSKAEQSVFSLIFKFPWGTVSSLLDIKGVQAIILINFLSAA